MHSLILGAGLLFGEQGRSPREQVEVSSAGILTGILSGSAAPASSPGSETLSISTASHSSVVSLPSPFCWSAGAGAATGVENTAVGEAAETETDEAEVEAVVKEIR